MKAIITKESYQFICEFNNLNATYNNDADYMNDAYFNAHADLFINSLNILEDLDVNFSFNLTYETFVNDKLEEKQTMNCKFTQTDTIDAYLKQTIMYFCEDAYLIMSEFDEKQSNRIEITIELS